MAVGTKWKRKIIVDNKTYLWNVKEDSDSPYYILNIVSEDKSIFISCPIGTETSYAIIQSGTFHKMKIHTWRRFLLPVNVPIIVTPGFVSVVIEWAMSDEDITEVTWNGKNIPV